MLPFNLENLMRGPSGTNIIEINRIIKMKALAWNLLSLIISYVPNVIIRENLNATVSLAKVFELLKKNPKATMK